MEKKFFEVKERDRIDKFLAKELETSRNQVEGLIKKGLVRIGQRGVKKGGQKVGVGDIVEVTFPKRESSAPKEVNFMIDRIYEDDDILVLNKPAGIVVHPAPSVKEATLVDWLKKEGITLSTIAGEERHGIVHRLDKETSGLLVIAKNNEAHQKLSDQLKDKSMGRYYLAIIEPPLKENIIVEQPIARNPKNRLKMGVVAGGREAKSAFSKVALSKDSKKELIAAKLYTGRTHQIRVHLGFVHRHILGDRLYGFKSKSDTIPRVFLHAYILYLIHPKSGQKMRFVAPLHEDMQNYLDKHFNGEEIYEKIDPDHFDTLFDFTYRLRNTADSP